MHGVGGLDPGGQGCLFFLSEDRKYSDSIRFKTTSPEKTALLIRHEWAVWYDFVAFMELTHGMRGDHPNHAYTFGRSAGLIEGMLMSNAVKIIKVDPGVWQRHYGIYGLKAKFELEGMTESQASYAAKTEAVKVAKQLFKVVTRDTADAQLICNFGWKKTFGGLK